MDDLKVYTPKVVPENPLPGEEEGEDFSITEHSSNGTYTPTTIKEQRFPLRKVATELLSDVLNTKSRKILKEFGLTQSGGFVIGEYVNGISGDVRITPAGITARDKAGNTTVGIDAETGDAVFAGQIQGESIVTGLLAVGDDSIVIDGEAGRIVMYDDDGTARLLIGNDV